MKQITVLFLTILTTIAAAAQPKAEILVSYTEQSKNYETDTVVSRQMSLLAGPEGSKYFNDLSLWSDSLSSTPEGKKQLQQIIMAACMTKGPDGGMTFDMRKGPVKKVHTYVYCNPSENSLKYYGKFADYSAYYDEPLDEMQWEIGDSTATILGYECLSATTDYHGRRWTAWFAPEIPMPFGPWKFHGLPGLILKAEADGGFEYLATGIEKTDRTMTPIYSPDDYQKTDRKKALAENAHFLDNREAMIKAKFGGNVQFNYDSSSRPKFDARKYATEPDYDSNTERKQPR